MQRKETAIEVKVGALVLVSLALFAGFVFLLGDFRFGESFHVYVDFTNAGGLKPGADVRIAGIPAGAVDEIQFMGGIYDEEVERNVYVRVRLSIDEGMDEAIGEGASFIITTLGVLGEPYVEVVNTLPPGEPVALGTKFEGTTPPRMDELIASVYDGVQGLGDLIDNINLFFEESDLRRLIHETANFAEDLDDLLEENSQTITHTISNIDYVLEENKDNITPILENVEQATAALNRALDGGTTIRNSIRNIDRVMAAAAEHAPGTLADLESTMDSLERVIGEREESLSQALANVETISANLVEVSEDVAELVDYVNAGRGTVGALLRDDEIYDDFREFIRELKRRPWRLLWRE